MGQQVISSTVRSINERHAVLAEAELQHALRMNMLTDVAYGTNKYSGISDGDVKRWVDEEAAYYEQTFDDLTADLMLLDEEHESGRVDDGVYEYVDERLGDATERMHRDFTQMHEVAEQLDAKFGDTSYADMIYGSLYGTTHTQTQATSELKPIDTPEVEEELDDDFVFTTRGVRRSFDRSL